MGIVYGSHIIDPTYVRESVLPRIRKLSKKTADGCRVWTGGKSRGGYATMQIKVDGGRWVSTGVHRLLAVLKHGNDACAGMDIDHTCRNTACVRVDHLEPVPHVVNVARGRVGTEEHSRNVSKALMGDAHPHRGKKLPPEHRKSISKALMGNTYRRGKKASEETRAKMREAQRRRRERERSNG